MGAHIGVQKAESRLGARTHRPPLPTALPGGKLPAMNIRRKRIELNEKLRKAIEEMDGEPLKGSGFERETPEPEFTDNDLPLRVGTGQD